jgi:hypothetical protein
MLFHREETKKTKEAKKKQSIGFLRVLRSLRFFAVKSHCPKVHWFDLGIDPASSIRHLFSEEK